MKFLIALLFAANLTATSAPDYISTNYYDPSIVISFNNWNGSKLNVSIFDESEELVFEDRLNTSKSDGIRYNLRNLESGKYIVVLENEYKIVKEKLILFDGKIVEKDADEYFKPVITKNGDKVKVNFLSYNDNATVSIYNEAGTLVFEELSSDAKPLSKTYNISDLERGSYTIKVSNDIVSSTMSIEK